MSFMRAVQKVSDGADELARSGESKRRSPSRAVVAVLSLIVLGAALRVFFLFSTRFTIDSDEAIVGLMGKHISEGGQWPIFYYGQPYMGSLEPLLVGAAFKMLGVSNFALLLVPLLFSVWLIWLVYRLAARFTDEVGAVTAAALAAVPPLALMEWGLKPRGGFIELVALGTLSLILAFDLFRAPSRLRACALGGVLGLAWWTNNQAVFFMAPVGVVGAVALLRSKGVREGSLLGCVILGSFLIGGAPFWYANLFQEPRFSTFAVIGGHSSLRESVSHLRGFFVEALPILFGARRFWSVMDIFPLSTVLAFSLYGVLIVGAYRKISRGAPRALLFLFLVLVPVIFSKSAFGWLTSAPRYLLPLYPVLFVLVSAGSRSVRGGGVLVVGIFLLNLASNYLGGVRVPGQPFVHGGERVAVDHKPLYRWLEEQGYNRIRTSYWIGYRVAFETKEQVTFSLVGEPRTVRIPEYELDSNANAPYVLVPSEARIVEPLLASQGWSYRRSVVGEYVVLDRVFRSVESDTLALIAPSRLTSSSREGWLDRLTDGDRGTRWGSGAPQAPEMFVHLHFATPQAVSGIEIESGFWPQDAARGLLIIAQAEDGSECILYDGVQFSPWSPERGRFLVTFPPQKLVALKLVQTGSHPILDWSMAEVRVLAPR